MRIASPRLLPSLCSAALVAALALPEAVAAQKVGWDVKGELSASLFFGNTQQSVVTTHTSVTHSDSTFELGTDARFTYGEARDANGESFVSQRSWLGALSGDFQPFATVSPFLLATIESSFEKRIDLRYSAGAGGKLTIVRRPGTKLSVSLALLGERSFFPDTVNDTPALVRWSARLKATREISDRVSLTHVTFYRPKVSALGRFAVISNSSAAYKLNEITSLTLTFLDNYDSEATSRGARSNNDGQLVVGVLAVF
jgi:Protein of unknown function, DUF481